MQHILKATISLAALCLTAGAAFADCGLEGAGSVRILSNDFDALRLINKTAEECASGTVTVTSNPTAEHKNLQVPALTINSAEYTVAMVANNSIVPLLNDDLIRPLGDLVAKYGQDLLPNQLIKIDGKVMAIAFMGNGQHLFYRKDILEQAGVAAPTSYADVLAAAAKIKEAAWWNIRWPPAWSRAGDLAAEFVNGYLGTGAEFFAPGSAELAIDNAQGAAVLQTMRDMTAFMDPNYLTFDASEIQKEHESGEVHIMNEWARSRVLFIDDDGAAEGVVANTVLAAAPTIDGGTVPAAALWWDGFTIAKNISDANARVATWLVEGYEPGPAAVGVTANANGDARTYPIQPYMGLLHTLLSTEPAEFIAGKEDAAQALADVKAAYDAAAKEAGLL